MNALTLSNVYKAVMVLCLLAIGQISLADPPPAPAGYKWERVWSLSDEFNDNTIDPNKWSRSHTWIGRAPSEFKPERSSEGGGYLKLQSKKVPEYWKDGAKRWMHAAYVTSTTARFTTGMYSECSLKASREGMVTGFWFYNAPGNYGNEIDVTEAVGYAANPNFQYLETKMRINSHNYFKGPAPDYEWLNDCETKHNKNLSKVGENFHTYGVWRKNKRDMSFYVDNGWVTNKSSCRDMNADLRLIMNSELQNWIGIPPNWALNDDKRNTAYVDFVRTWKLVPCNNCGGGGGSSSAKIIALKNEGNNRYISSENGTKAMNCNRTAIGGWEKFEIVDLGGGQYAFKGNNGKYVSSENGSRKMNCNRSAVGGWEKFRLEHQGNQVYAIKGNNGKYIGSDMWCTKNSVYSSTKFKITWGLSRREGEIAAVETLPAASVYPNPLNGDNYTLKLGLANDSDVQLFAYDRAGKQLYSNSLRLSSGIQELQLKASEMNMHAKGMYILKIIKGDEEEIVRIIK